MTNRVIVNAMYFDDDNSDGTYTQCSSSRGNESIVEEQKSVIGKDVIAINHVGYIHLEPTETGVNWSSVLCQDLSGSIPGALKGKIANR